ncbi:DUF2461 family protein [Candidatus Thiosymbion oneisti]|uniref:DUF2461 family protein n=1 Tax=Candidatus Thiosymbion oneisti TaxID=589554 RepID=UPI000B7CFCF6|nr:DUF2461 family protein [Candidatus Thiosymbion oneisti]
MTHFSSDTFRFLGDLTGFRDKQWFDANRSRYEAHVLEPMRSLVSVIGAQLREQVPDMEIRPQVNKCITRINRDMRFARGKSPYKDHMLALFYREGRKKEDPQLFVGIQPTEVWVGLYLSPPFLASDSAIARAVQDRPDRVVALGRALGIGEDLMLGSCSRYGEIENSMNGGDAEHYVTGPHLCAMRIFPANEVAADPADFVEEATEILTRLVPLWRAYLEGI